MRKSLGLVVKPVVNLFRVCGVFGGLFSGVKNTGFAVGYKNGGLYKVLQLVSPTFFHLKNSLFVSVNSILIPTIHTTYNKLQLIKLNTLLLIPEEVL
jgi:hypothetical protein